ncbi:hypothetical protein AB0D14_39565 [Streptomyces sp. NPDC048484]|uniref:hypothetical protein n=1 Tax=Streptomyces sp. NPDC048484 TaxID=3155146 RepID=UPI0034270D52
MSTRTTVHATWRRALVTLTAASAALAALVLPAAASAHDREGNGHAITVNGSRAFPESVAADRHYVYTASIADGTVYCGHPGAKTLDPFLPGGQDGRTQATGLKTTGNRLLVAGAFTGRFFVYTNTGKLVYPQTSSVFTLESLPVR